eukprot:TRINITY_DN2087_c0_g1_i1.p1 TRINITY_DN2087_c0_g1~~TRINITY_DN2087_c0_g1_i1.p1  ORF type:complete len:336 (+),score=68.63 TRINITY_DN2087_c0_g1_i1:24-1010(+)
MTALREIFRIPDEVLTSRFTPVDVANDLRVIQLRFEDWEVLLERSMRTFQRIDDDISMHEARLHLEGITAADRFELNKLKARMHLIREQLHDLDQHSCAARHSGKGFLPNQFSSKSISTPPHSPPSVASTHTAEPSIFTRQPSSAFGPSGYPAFIDNKATSCGPDTYNRIFQGMYTPAPTDRAPKEQGSENAYSRIFNKADSREKGAPGRVRFPQGRCILHTPTAPVVRIIRANKFVDRSRPVPSPPVEPCIELLSLSHETTDLIGLPGIKHVGRHRSIPGGMEITTHSRYPPHVEITYVLEMNPHERDSWVEWVQGHTHSRPSYRLT